MPPEQRSSPSLLLVAAAFALTGLPVSVRLLLGWRGFAVPMTDSSTTQFLSESAPFLVFMFPAVTALLAAWIWRFLVAESGRGASHGAAAGALAALLAHPVAWVLMFWITKVTDPVPFVEVQDTLIFAMATLFGIGWLTVPAGGLMGYLLARAQGRAAPAETETTATPRVVLATLFLTLAAFSLAWFLGRDTLNPELRRMMLFGPVVAVFAAGARTWWWSLPNGKVHGGPLRGSFSGAATGLVIHPLACAVFFTFPETYGVMRPGEALASAIPAVLMSWLVAAFAGALAAALISWRAADRVPD